MVYLFNIFFAFGLNLLAITAWIDGIPAIPDESRQVTIEGIVTGVKCPKNGKYAKYIEYEENKKFELAVFSIKEFKCGEARKNWENRRFIAYFNEQSELFSPFKVMINGVLVYDEDRFIASKITELILYTVLAAGSNLFWLYYFLVYKKK